MFSMFGDARQSAPARFVLAHDPEKLTDFSDKIMRKSKKMQSEIASI